MYYSLLIICINVEMYLLVRKSDQVDRYNISIKFKKIFV